MNLASLLKLLPVVGPVLARGQEFIDWYHEASASLHLTDQRAAQDALAAIQAENDEGHQCLQAKAAAAAKK